MKLLVALLSVVLLVGCTAKVINADGSRARPLVDTGSESIHFIVPNGSKIGSQASRPGIQVREYVPNDQSVDNWTDMLTVVVMSREAAPIYRCIFPAHDPHISRKVRCRCVG